MNVGKPRMVGNHGKALGGELGCRTSGLLNVLGWSGLGLSHGVTGEGKGYSSIKFVSAHDA